MNIPRQAGKVVSLIQLGAILGTGLCIILYRMLGFATSSMYYKDGLLMDATSGLFTLVAIVSSLVMIIMPSEAYTRKRSFIGFCISMILAVIDFTFNPIILPEGVDI